MRRVGRSLSRVLALGVGVGLVMAPLSPALAAPKAQPASEAEGAASVEAPDAEMAPAHTPDAEALDAAAPEGEAPDTPPAPSDPSAALGETPEPAAVSSQPTAIPTPVMPVAVEPAPAPSPAAEELRKSKQMMNGGTALLVVGVASLLTITLPSFVLREVALRRASRDTYLLVEKETLRERAQRRLVIGSVSGAVGLVMTVAGIALLAAGSQRHKEATRRRASLAPGPGLVGVGARLRF